MFFFLRISAVIEYAKVKFFFITLITQKGENATGFVIFTLLGD